MYTPIAAISSIALTIIVIIFVIKDVERAASIADKALCVSPLIIAAKYPLL